MSSKGNVWGWTTSMFSKNSKLAYKPHMVHTVHGPRSFSPHHNQKPNDSMYPPNKPQRLTEPKDGRVRRLVRSSNRPPKVSVHNSDKSSWERHNSTAHCRRQTLELGEGSLKRVTSPGRRCLDISTRDFL